MNDSSSIHQVRYILSIRSEYAPLGSPIYRGTLETVSGQKFEFGNLEELNSLLCEICGWIDKPPLADEEGEVNPSSRAIETNSPGGNN